eukprot:CAMPEP_0176266942 /NCGR_PEP_ID=MMETSP0121_2-20121125/42905_1 /TAXON_ID=160619 /ORGANISM="Kryptoperidinium foliaceum, Strain CCMP 1326" /LENGTH=362 /DNA_ID=CAMNT_0017606993 /DNA_START=54 /DNA_END=1140 /DNA_ORIENTATION=-
MTRALPVDVYGLLALRILELWAGRSIPNRVPWLHLAVAIVYYVLYIVLVFGVTIFLLVIVNKQAFQWEDSNFTPKHNMTVSAASDHLRAVMATDAVVNSTHHPGVSNDLFATCRELNKVPQQYIYLLLHGVLLGDEDVDELKSARDWIVNMLCVDTQVDPSQMTMSPDGANILSVPTVLKVVIMLFVAFVKIVIFVLVLHICCVFLLMQTNGFALVIKVIAMSVVLGIDEQVVESLALREACQKLRSTNIQLRSDRTFLNKMYWYDGVGGMVFLSSAVLVVLLYTNVLFGDLMGLRKACNDYIRSGFEVFDLRGAAAYLEIDDVGGAMFEAGGHASGRPPREATAAAPRTPRASHGRAAAIG